MTRRTIILLLLWMALLAAAFTVDGPAKTWLAGHHFAAKSAHLAKGTMWAETLKLLGWYPSIILIAVVLQGAGAYRSTLAAIDRQPTQEPLPRTELRRILDLYGRRTLVILACAATAALNDPLKWVFGRARPLADNGTVTPQFDFHPFTNGIAGLFQSKHAAFPSGHTMLAFATATILARYYPKWRYLLFLFAMLVGMERVLEVAHHVSDVVCAAGLGVIFSLLCARLLEPWAEKPGLMPESEKGKAAV